MLRLKVGCRKEPNTHKYIITYIFTFLKLYSTYFLLIALHVAYTLKVDHVAILIIGIKLPDELITVATIIRLTTRSLTFLSLIPLYPDIINIQSITIISIIKPIKALATKSPIPTGSAIGISIRENGGNIEGNTAENPKDKKKQNILIISIEMVNPSMNIGSGVFMI